jgi:hypothetical protein
LFGFGKIIFGEYLTGVIFLLIGIVAALIIFWDLNRRGWEKIR